MIYKKFKFLNNRNILSMIISLLVFSFILFISRSDTLYIVNKNIQSIYYKYLEETVVSSNILVIEIDEDTLSWRKMRDGTVTKQWLWRFPFDRKYFATVIDNLSKAWATVIAIDVIFWEKSNELSDNLLSESIKNSWNVILWMWSNSAWNAEFPYEKFSKHLLTEWFYSVTRDEKSHSVYSLTPFKKYINSDKIYDHFAIATLRWFYSKIYNDESYLTKKFINSDNRITLDDRIQLIRSNNNKNNILINYVSTDRFIKKSFLDIYYWNFKESDVKDKIVLIWETAEWIKDVFETPIWLVYWVYLHANIINTIISNIWISYMNFYVEWFLIFLLILISAYFNISRSSYVLILSNIWIIWLFISFVIFLILFTNYLLTYIIEFAVALLLSLAVSNIVKYYIENNSRLKLNKALSEYVSEDVANEILSWEWKINLNWENKSIAIFFSDIEWFTSLSEKFSPEELVAFLREYLTEMSNIIMDEKWFINKYEWDAIMALWWVFWSDWIETYRICITALKQQELLKKMNLKWNNQHSFDIKVRMGIHVWNAIIWNIGAVWRKMEFTALWDNVNLASRLESVNKFYWTYICVSEDIYEKEKDNFEFRYLDNIRVVWKKTPVKIYELFCIKWKLRKEEEEIQFKYRIAINIYKNMKFQKALSLFEELSEMWDSPSNTYKERCEFYLKNPPWEFWDCVRTMTSK